MYNKDLFGPTRREYDYAHERRLSSFMTVGTSSVSGTAGGGGANGAGGGSGNGDMDGSDGAGGGGGTGCCGARCGGGGRRGGQKCTAARAKSCMKMFFAQVFSHVGLCALVVGYAIMGAFIFVYLEQDNEMATRRKVGDTRTKTLDELYNITGRMETFV